MPAAEHWEISAGGLLLSFVWRQDRYRHMISLLDAADRGAEPEQLLASLEGEPDELWPASPVLQELHVESRAGGKSVALLVGRAGRSHWSLSALADPERGELVFDAACRCGGQPAWLGSSYLGAEIPTLPESQDRAARRRDERNCQRPPSPRASVWLAPLLGDRRWRLTPAEAGVPVVGERMAIEAAGAWDDSRRTVQWSYRVWIARDS